MAALISTFTDRFGEWTTSLLEHLQISLLSLLLAMLIAIPLGIVTSNYKRLSSLILQITGIFQTFFPMLQ